MTRHSLCLSIAFSLLSACAIGPKSGSALPAVDARGIRDLGYGPFVLDFLAIKAGTEDRVVLEFNIDNVGRRVERMVLKIPLENLDDGGDAGVIEVFTFTGDGVVSPSEFGAGQRIGKIAADAGGNVRVDVTPAVRAAKETKQEFIGFRLSTEGADRYFLGQIVDLRDPVLRIPERD